MKKIRRISAFVTAIALSAGTMGVFPFAEAAMEAEASYTRNDIVSAIHKNDYELHKNDAATTYDDYYPEYDQSWLEKDNPHIDTSDFPEKFELRNVDGKNYVPPIRNQGYWSTCWSFGAIAAAETSMASAKDFDYNNADLSWLASLYDLSEKHLAWFSAKPLSEESGKYLSQAGEGYYSTDEVSDNPAAISSAVYDRGGFQMYATTMFSAGVGPVFESAFPYEPTDKETLYDQCYLMHIYIDEDTQKISYYDFDTLYTEYIRAEDFSDFRDRMMEKYPDYEYMTYDKFEQLLEGVTEEDIGKHYIRIFYWEDYSDWSLDESDRFKNNYELKDGSLLPPPAGINRDYSYRYNQIGTDAIKSELLNGRGVSVGFCSDSSFPDDVQEIGSYMNFLDENGTPTNEMEKAAIWAHYTYDKNYDPDDPDSINHYVYSDHAVCIVGYDDNFPKEYFYDPKGTIGGDGAWIVRNSWGSKNTNTDPDSVGWGNNGDGYFYISYYDQSLDTVESFNINNDSDTSFLMKNINMYDFLPVYLRERVTFDDEVSTANVFTADNNCVVRFIGVEVCGADSDVEYSIYKLNDGAESPVDGELFMKSSEHFTFSGYHMIDLGRALRLRKGEKYSVVVKIKNAEGYQLNYARDQNRQGLDFYNDCEYQRHINAGYDPENFYPYNEYAKAVVNKGESYVGSGDNWSDWADVIDDLREINKDMNNDGYDYDNFAIRSYPETEYFAITNKPVNEQESYKAGDILEGIMEIAYNTDDWSTIDEIGMDIELELSIGGKLFPVGEDNNDAKFTSLAHGETISVPYKYTVTEEDVAAGSIESSVRLKTIGVYYDIERKHIFPEDMTFTVLTSADSADNKNPETTTVNSSSKKSESSTTTAKAAATSSPKTGVAAPKGIIAILTTALVVSAVCAAGKKRREDE